VPVEVVRGRAEDAAVRIRLAGADVVVSRAVADLEKLARWSLPLLRPGGRMMALKGERAAEEVADRGRSMAALGAVGVEVVQCGTAYLSSPTTVVVAVHGATARRRKKPGRPARSFERRGP
jgi:16S rRNA (guanine527-N7)-methyltransferase